MAVAPPLPLVHGVERFLPGIYGKFVTRIVRTFAAGRTPVVVSSWYRDPATNAATPGSARRSQHLLGLAVDLVPRTNATVEVARRTGLIVLDEGDHVHIQAWPAEFGGPLVSFMLGADNPGSFDLGDS